MKMQLVRGGLLTAALLLSLSCIANAGGTIRVQQPDGSVQIYPNAQFKVVHKTLHLTSGDKVGTLIITDAACSVGANEIMMCLPYSMVLVQNGTHPLDFHHGTLYYNRSTRPQTLSMSSTQLPPNGLTGLLVSRRGTYVTFSGTLDGRY